MMSEDIFVFFFFPPSAFAIEATKTGGETCVLELRCADCNWDLWPLLNICVLLRFVIVSYLSLSEGFEVSLVAHESGITWSKALLSLDLLSGLSQVSISLVSVLSIFSVVTGSAVKELVSSCLIFSTPVCFTFGCFVCSTNEWHLATQLFGDLGKTPQGWFLFKEKLKNIKIFHKSCRYSTLGVSRINNSIVINTLPLRSDEYFRLSEVRPYIRFLPAQWVCESWAIFETCFLEQKLQESGKLFVKGNAWPVVNKSSSVATGCDTKHLKGNRLAFKMVLSG